MTHFLSDGQTKPVPVSPNNPLPVTLAINPSTTAATMTRGTKTVAAAGTPEALVGVATLVQSVTIYPLRTNTGDVFIGTVVTNDAQHAEPPLVVDAPPGKKIDLANLFVDVAVAGEGVAYEAIN